MRMPVARSATISTETLQNAIGRQILQATEFSRAARLVQQDRSAYLNSPDMLPFLQMVPLSAGTLGASSETFLENPFFAIKSDRLAFSWFEPVESDLHLLSRYKNNVRKQLKVEHHLVTDMDYASLIPPQARKIYIGEEHNQPTIYRAVEALLLAYRKKYPQRPVILLTEFVSDRLFPWGKPGARVPQLEMPLRRNNEDFDFLNRLMDNGVDVIGLEDTLYFQDHAQPFNATAKETSSVYGMQERNAHWRQIIDEVSRQNPQAVLFIYAGVMHTHYRAPFSLSTTSNQNFVLQMEMDYLKPDLPFGFIMRHSPLAHAEKNQVTVLSWPKGSIWRVRSGFDKCLIFPQLPTQEVP